MGKKGKGALLKKWTNSVINSGETGARTGQQIIWGTMSVKNWGFLLLTV